MKRRTALAVVLSAGFAAVCCVVYAPTFHRERIVVPGEGWYVIEHSSRCPVPSGNLLTTFYDFTTTQVSYLCCSGDIDDRFIHRVVESKDGPVDRSRLHGEVVAGLAAGGCDLLAEVFFIGSPEAFEKDYEGYLRVVRSVHPECSDSSAKGKGHSQGPRRGRGR